MAGESVQGGRDPDEEARRSLRAWRFVRDLGMGLGRVFGIVIRHDFAGGEEPTGGPALLKMIVKVIGFVLGWVHRRQGQ